MQLKLQVVLIPVGDTDISAAGMAARKFLHLASPTSTLSEVCDALLNRYYKLYPDAETLDLEGIQDKDCCDLDPDFAAGDVFGLGDILRVLVRNSFHLLLRDTSTVLPAGILDVLNALVKRGASPDSDADFSRVLKRSRTIWAARQSSANTSTVSASAGMANSRPKLPLDRVASSPVHLPPPVPLQRDAPAKITPHKRTSPVSASKGRRITSGMLVAPTSTEKSRRSIFSDNDDTDIEAHGGSSFLQVARPLAAVSVSVRGRESPIGSTDSANNSDADVTVVTASKAPVHAPVAVSSPLPQPLPKVQAQVQTQTQASAVSLRPPEVVGGKTPSKSVTPNSSHLASLTPELQRPTARLTSLKRTALWPRALQQTINPVDSSASTPPVVDVQPVSVTVPVSVQNLVLTLGRVLIEPKTASSSAQKTPYVVHPVSPTLTNQKVPPVVPINTSASQVHGYPYQPIHMAQPIQQTPFLVNKPLFSHVQPLFPMTAQSALQAYRSYQASQAEQDSEKRALDLEAQQAFKKAWEAKRVLRLLNEQQAKKEAEEEEARALKAQQAKKAAQDHKEAQRILNFQQAEKETQAKKEAASKAKQAEEEQRIRKVQQAEEEQRIRKVQQAEREAQLVLKAQQAEKEAQALRAENAEREAQALKSKQAEEARDLKANQAKAQNEAQAKKEAALKAQQAQREALKVRQAEEEQRILKIQQAERERQLVLNAQRAEKEAQALRVQQAEREAQALKAKQAEETRVLKANQARAQKEAQAKNEAALKAKQAEEAQRILNAQQAQREAQALKARQAEEEQRILKAQQAEREAQRVIKAQQAEKRVQAQKEAQALKAKQAEKEAQALRVKQTEEARALRAKQTEEAQRVLKAQQVEKEVSLKAKLAGQETLAQKIFQAQKGAQALKAQQAQNGQNLPKSNEPVVPAQSNRIVTGTGSTTTSGLFVSRESSSEPIVLEIDSDVAVNSDVVSSNSPNTPSVTGTSTMSTSNSNTSNGKSRANAAADKQRDSSAAHSAASNDAPRLNSTNQASEGPTLPRDELIKAFKRKNTISISSKVREMLGLPSTDASLEPPSEEQWKSNRIVEEELRNRQNAAKAGANVGDRRTRSRATVNSVPDLETIRANSALEKKEKERESKAKQLPFPFNGYTSKAKLSSDLIKLQKLDAKIDKREAERVAMSEAVKLEDVSNGLGVSLQTTNSQHQAASLDLSSGPKADLKIATTTARGLTIKSPIQDEEPVDDNDADMASESESGDADSESESDGDSESESEGAKTSTTNTEIVSGVEPSDKSKETVFGNGNVVVDVDQNTLKNETLGSEELGSEELGSEDLGSEDLGSEDLGSEELGSEDLGNEELHHEKETNGVEKAAGPQHSEVQKTDINKKDDQSHVASQDGARLTVIAAESDESSSEELGSSEEDLLAGLESEDESSGDESVIVTKDVNTKVQGTPGSKLPKRNGNPSAARASSSRIVNGKLVDGRPKEKEVILIDSSSESEIEDLLEDEEPNPSKTHNVSGSGVQTESPTAKNGITKATSGGSGKVSASIVSNSVQGNRVTSLPGKVVGKESSVSGKQNLSELKETTNTPRGEKLGSEESRPVITPSKRAAESPISNPPKKIKAGVLDHIIPKTSKNQNAGNPSSSIATPEQSKTTRVVEGVKKQGDDLSHNGKKPITTGKVSGSQAPATQTPVKSKDASSKPVPANGQKSNSSDVRRENIDDLKSPLGIDKKAAATQGEGKNPVVKAVPSESISNSDSDSDSISDSSSELDSDESIDLSDESQEKAPLAPSTTVTKTILNRLLPKSYKPTVSKPLLQPVPLSQPKQNENQVNVASQNSTQAAKNTEPKPAAPKSTSSVPVKNKFPPIKKPSLASLADLSQRGLPQVTDKMIAAGIKPTKPPSVPFGASSSESSSDSSSGLDSDSSDSSDDDSDDSDGENKFMSVKNIEKSKQENKKKNKKKKGGFSALMKDVKKK